MKRCPACQSTYTDDSLVYCLQDGATLQSEADAANPLSLLATLHDDSVHAHAASDEPPPTQVMDFASTPTVQLPGLPRPISIKSRARLY